MGKSNMSWSDAESYCQRQGMNLWVINSYTEWRTLVDFTHENVDNQHLNHKNIDLVYVNAMFIGLVKRNKVI